VAGLLQHPGSDTNAMRYAKEQHFEHSGRRLEVVAIELNEDAHEVQTGEVHDKGSRDLKDMVLNPDVRHVNLETITVRIGCLSRSLSRSFLLLVGSGSTGVRPFSSISRLILV